MFLVMSHRNTDYRSFLTNFYFSATLSTFPILNISFLFGSNCQIVANFYFLLKEYPDEQYQLLWLHPALIKLILIRLLFVPLIFLHLWRLFTILNNTLII